MLAADKGALHEDLRVQMLEIQKRELDHISSNLNCLTTASAVLLGFGITLMSGVNEISPNTAGGGGPPLFCMGGWIWGATSMPNGEQNCPMPRAVVYTFDGLYALFVGLAIGCNFITLFLSSAVLMAGPGMALRGPEGSLVIAVRHMEEQNKRALRFFGRGLVSFVCGAFFLGINFALYDEGPVRGVLLCLTMLWTVTTLLRYGADIMTKFYVAPDRSVTGQFFVSSKSGKIEWVHKPGSRTRPPGHGFLTPLLRLDKILTFPYYDAKDIARKVVRDKQAGSARGRQSSMSARSAQEQLALEAMIRANQEGPKQVSAPASENGGLDDLYDSALGALHDLFPFMSKIAPVPPTSPAPPVQSRRRVAAALCSRRSLSQRLQQSMDEAADLLEAQGNAAEAAELRASAVEMTALPHKSSKLEMSQRSPSCSNCHAG